MWTLGATLLGATSLFNIACKERGHADDSSAQSRVQAATEQAPAPSVSTTSTTPPTPDLPAGLEYIDGPGVIERVKATKAKGVVVNVWASWCGPCKAEVPMLLKLQQELGPDALDFVFVSVDAPDKGAAALTFRKEQDLPGPGLLVRPPLSAFKAALTPRWRGSLPATFLFDASGKLRYWWGAQVFEHEITPILRGYLAGEHIDGEANFQIRKGGGAPE